MSKFSLRDSIYLSDNPEETTFKYDDRLPSLPVPTVEQSVAKLLDTIKPIVTDEATFRETQRKAQEFIEDPEVAELQTLLIRRAGTRKNWLEEWWLEFAYLRSRKPLIPYSNMSAPLPIMNYWPVAKPTELGPEKYSKIRAHRAALSCYFKLCFWRMLREEKMRPMIHKGSPWSMSQFRYLFNTVRQPGDPKDKLVSWFKTVREGKAESIEVVVLHRGYVFVIKPVTMIGQTQSSILPAPLIERQLNYIEAWCSDKPYGPSVASLTTMERTDWAEAKEKLSAICETNQQNLDRIDKALFVLALDDNEPVTTDEIFSLSVCGDSRNRWADKSVCSIAFKNGTFGASADHTPYDGFCTGIMTHYLITSVQGCNGIWDEELSSSGNSSWANFFEPELLDFKLDIQISQTVDDAQVQFKNITATIDTLHRTFEHYGKAILKEHRFHPEAFIQCALHAAYFRQHKKMAPTYVTASTRRFHNGRTETCRSCYPEMKEFALFLTKNDSSKPKQAYELLRTSVNKFQKLMEEASNGLGCDRHLLGLYLTAIFEGKHIPDLFDDELVLRTNNYILSTSCGGYWNVCGGVPPYVEDGYGFFYGIEDHAITICCTAYRPCPSTDLRQFYDNLNHVLLELHKILISSKL